MSYMKLLKLLYLADRTALLRWGKPITTDRWVAMKHGPVLSNVYSLISDEQAARNSTWSRYISAPEQFEVVLISERVHNDRLSRAEEKLIDEIYDSYGQYSRWDLVEHLHKVLPEWTNPGETSRPIHRRDILGLERGEEEVSGIEQELSTFAREMAALHAG